MANSLLDFVMSLVRDPDAAAHYAANPAQAIADAQLGDVTSVDVNHLIPVVAESMSSVMPSGGLDAGLDSAHNVWASGAATAAFDAFDDHLPIHGGDWMAGELADQVPTVASVIEQPEDSAPTIIDSGVDVLGGFDGLGGLDVPTIATGAESSLGLDVPTYDDVHAVAGLADDSLDDHHAVPDAVDDHLSHSQDPDFDMFT